MRTVVISLLLAAIVPAPAQASRTTAHASRYKNFSCILRNGPEYRWTVPGSGGRRRIKSTTYLVEGFGTTCSYAKTWVRRLAKEPYRGARKSLKHGPAGWRCLSQQNSPALHVATAYKGDCQNRKDPRRVFSWGPQTGYDDKPVDPPVVPDPPAEPAPADPPAYP